MKDHLAVIVGVLVIVLIIVVTVWASWGAVNCWIDGGIWVTGGGIPGCVERM